MEYTGGWKYRLEWIASDWWCDIAKIFFEKSNKFIMFTDFPEIKINLIRANKLLSLHILFRIVFGI